MQDKHYGRQNKRREQRVDIRNSHNINDFYTNRQMHMTKELKPGQLCTVDKKLYRAKNEMISGTCTGCAFRYDAQLCANIRCGNYGVILQEVKIKKEKLHA
jgi:hypothetical protein